MVKRNKTEKDYFCCKYSTLVVIGQCTDPYQIFVMCMLRLHMKFVFIYACRYLYTPRLYLRIENAYIAHYRFSYAFHPQMSLLQNKRQIEIESSVRWTPKGSFFCKKAIHIISFCTIHNNLFVQYLFRKWEEKKNVFYPF